MCVHTRTFCFAKKMSLTNIRVHEHILDFHSPNPITSIIKTWIILLSEPRRIDDDEYCYWQGDPALPLQQLLTNYQCPAFLQDSLIAPLQRWVLLLIHEHNCFIS
jgi:hypothetical protein